MWAQTCTRARADAHMPMLMHIYTRMHALTHTHALKGAVCTLEAHVWTSLHKDNPTDRVTADFNMPMIYNGKN